MTHPSKQRFGAVTRRFFGVPFRRQTYRNVAHLALAFSLGMPYLVRLASGLSAGLGLVTTLAGIQLLVATPVAVVGAARFEAKLASWLLDTEIEEQRVLRRLDRNVGRLDDLVDTTRELLTAATTWTGLTGLVGCVGTVIRIESADTTVERRFDAIAVGQLEVTNATDGDVTVTSL